MKHKANGQITLLALSERPAAEKTMNAARMHMMPINGKIIIFLSNKSAYLYLTKKRSFCSNKFKDWTEYLPTRLKENFYHCLFGKAE